MSLKLSCYVILGLIITAHSKAQECSPVSLLRPSLNERVNNLVVRTPANLDHPPQGLNPNTMERIQSFAQNKVFIAYPGAPGLQTDVFVDNFEVIHRDFGVPKSQLIYRDILGAHARYAEGLANPNINMDSRNILGFQPENLQRSTRFARPPGTAVLLDQFTSGAGGTVCGLRKNSLAYLAAQEAAFLQSVYREFNKQIVVLCHSAGCRTSLGGVLAVLHGTNSASILDSYFFIQGAMPSQINTVMSSINNSLAERLNQLGQPGCSLSRQFTDSTGPWQKEAERVFFVADGYPQNHGNNFAAKGFKGLCYGRFLGALQTDHRDAVVSYGEGRSAKPLSYRRALMHVLMQIASEK